MSLCETQPGKNPCYKLDIGRIVVEEGVILIMLTARMSRSVSAE